MLPSSLESIIGFTIGHFYFAILGHYHFGGTTIAAFISSMKDEIVFLYRDILLVCEEEGLLGGTHFSLDGVKLSSNASKEKGLKKFYDTGKTVGIQNKHRQKLRIRLTALDTGNQY
jgi:hypothetical protein